MSDSDSEYKWLLLIKTPLSHKLNPTTLGTFTKQKGIVVEVIEMTKWLHAVETVSVPSDTKRDDKINKRTGSLDDLLLSTVDETMKQVFKEAGAKVIYNYMENKCHLKREEIFEKPEVFSAGLKKLLKSGAPVIEKMILKKLCCKLELKFAEEKGYEFSDYIKELKKSCSC